MDFLDGILGQIETATGTAANVPFWACEEGCPTIQAEDPGGAICSVCNKGRLFKGSIAKSAELMARSAKILKDAQAQPKTEAPSQAELEATGTTSIPEAPAEVKNPVFNAAEEVKAKIAAEKSALHARLDELDVPYSGRLGIKKLQELVAAAEAKQCRPVEPEITAVLGRGEAGPDVGASEPPRDVGKLDYAKGVSEQEQGCDTNSDTVEKAETADPEPEITDEPVTDEEPVIEEDETPEGSEPGEKVDYKALREAKTAALIKKFGLSEISPVLIGTAEVQSHGFTVWSEKDGKRVPSFRIQQPFESNTDFGKVYDSFKARHPSLSVDVVQCNNVSNQELKGCLYSGNLLAGLNNGNGTQMARVGETVKIGVLKTQKGHLRFVVLEIMR